MPALRRSLDQDRRAAAPDLRSPFPGDEQTTRSPALHAAAEAVGRQSADAFWPFWDSLVSDRAHTDDPYLWQRVEDLGLDLDRFEADRRSSEVEERVRRDFRSGIRAGVVGTPSAFVEAAR